MRYGRHALAALFLSGLLFATTGGNAVLADTRHDHDVAREALAAGEILPLRTLLQKIEAEHGGEVLEVELEREAAQWIYEVKMLRRDGGVNKLIFDARDGRLLEVKGRRHGRRRGMD